ncbi:hypothetical protein MASR1M74_01900 [Lentimicrobium sp.]
MLAFAFGSPAVSAQTLNTKIALAIRNANSKELSTYFNNTLDIALPGNEGTFSKAQAEMIMRDFFSKNPPVSFTINREGKSKDGSEFGIGTYKCARHEYRTSFLLKPVQGNLLIHQLRFGGDDDE